MLKGKLIWHPKLVGGVDDYLMAAALLGIYFAEDIALRIYYQVNGDKEQALKELRRVWDQRDDEDVRNEYNLGTPTDTMWWWPVMREELRMRDEEQDSRTTREVYGVGDSESDESELIIDLPN